ncbi:uncharacterized protein I303_104601 [Kwoniella dejecticola CBS 10117]|uniref:Uncharacterized protein n=1 Tax=Kwoniella dejecticola CBS 10117 TaxID=1296121 RepID=A0A1A6A4V2_9TREE|nr:uncharacterized protein I303_04421 [Kwoniella dejecticola CBS 10117]OBR85090.1 hypothetical protein I303_04421 [Kwoniella dejecticola CBS 10117]
MPLSPNKTQWNDEHTLILLRSIVLSTLSNRASFYSTPGLEGVNEHGGDRIHKKIQQLLKQLCGTVPGGQGIVEEVMKDIKRTKKERGQGVGNSMEKKRKIKDEE